MTMIISYTLIKIFSILFVILHKFTIDFATI
nr:MAG TPA: hypothetical protein [Caudoviricetes sp.]